MDKLTVSVSGPVLRVDRDGNKIDVSADQFAKKPDAVYTVPDTAFWQGLVVNKALRIVDQKAKSGRPAKEVGNEK